MREDFLNELNIRPSGIIYKNPPEGWNWPFINSSDGLNLRIIINAALYYNETYDEGELKIRIENKLGLHARASAFLVTTYLAWRNQFPYDRNIAIKLARDYKGDYKGVNPGSIMGVMMLACAKGTVLRLRYENCTRGEVESFLLKLRCVPDEKDKSIWIAADLSSGYYYES